MTDGEQNISSDTGRQDRRSYARVKVSVPVEMEAEGSDLPTRGSTTDLSLGGCYIETMFPFPVGTNLDLKLQLHDTLLIEATVVTSDPQVGNGIRFVRMLSEDREGLKAYLETAEREHHE
jgi:c-di-GMP-binding flagellar brake protein YcgR